jgi:hypothetical protein
VKHVAEPIRETKGEKREYVAVGGSEDKNSSIEANVWISSFAVGRDN